MYQIANLILQLRKQKGWTQAFAARAIGIQQSYLSKLENGKFLPSQEVCEKIAIAYDVDISKLRDNHLPEVKHSTIPIIDKWSVRALMMAALLFICAYFELFFSQRFYTYQFELPKGVMSELKLGFHITEDYLGERFIDPNDQLIYKLIGQRSITRKENNWLYALSLLLVLLTFARIVKLTFDASTMPSTMSSNMPSNKASEIDAKSYQSEP
jgi:transcriptional regulator with XRE-family HTH domain